ncbi:MAG: hypothetical protein RH917_05150 [Lacipirellulaceae bacterium]
MSTRTACTATLCMLLLGCTQNFLTKAEKWPSQKAMVTSGYAKILAARQIDDLFGPAWHYTTNYEKPNRVEWRSEFLFGGRYELHMSLPVEVDRQTGKVTRLIDEPEFLILEITAIEGRSISYARDYHAFDRQQWREVVKAKGDFSTIGIHLDSSQPVPGFSEYQKRVRNGIQIRSEPGSE